MKAEYLPLLIFEILFAVILYVIATIIINSITITPGGNFEQEIFKVLSLYC